MTGGRWSSQTRFTVVLVGLALVALGVLTAIGLVSALFSDGGFGDMLAWVTLGIPVVACLWFGWLRRRG